MSAMPVQKLGHKAKLNGYLVNTLEAACLLQQLEILSESYLGQVRLVVILGQKLGHYAKLKIILLTIWIINLSMLKLFQNVCLDITYNVGQV